MSEHLSAGATAAPAPVHPGPDGGLQRGLTSAQIAMIGLSGALGTGLFLGSGSMIKVAGPAITVSYTLTGLLVLVIVWALAEMTVTHPVAGGFGAAAHAYLGPLGGWLMRWNVGIVMCIAVGAEVVAAATYLSYWWPQFPIGLGTVAFSLLLVAINATAVKIYGASEYWFSLIKVAMVILFIVLGLVLVFVGLPGRPAVGLSNLTAHGGFAPNGISGVLVGAVLAIFSFGGAENVSIASAESENPERDVPRAARAMVARLVLFYVLGIAVVVALQPWTAVAASDGTVQHSPFVTVLESVNIPGAATIMNLVLVTAALSSGNGCLYAASRMFHSLATDRLAPASIARTTRAGAPRNAVVLATLGMVIASVLAIVAPDTAFQTLFGILVFGLLLTWTLVMVTYVAFRRQRAQLGLPLPASRLIGGTATAGVALVAIAAAYLSLLVIPSLTFALWTGLAYLAVLVAGYLVVRRRVATFPPSVLDAELAARGR